MIAPESTPGILLLGSESGFCFHALKTLRDLRLGVAEVLLATGTQAATARPVLRGSIPLSQPGTVADLAAREGISVIQCDSTQEDWAYELARELAPDVVLVACLPERLEARWCKASVHGCFNLHPSLLPAYRGPAPLFWQLRDGRSETGISVHRVESAIDCGALLAQETLRIGEDDTMATLNAALASAGVQLFARALASVIDGTAVLTPQDENAASYYPWPTQNDFRLDTAWTATRALSFVRATQSMGMAYRVELGNAALIIDRAVDADDHATMIDDVHQEGSVLAIRFAKGVLRAVGRKA